MCHAKQYDVIKAASAELTKTIRVAPAFYYVDIETLLQQYFFSNRLFCANYATPDTMKQEFFARGE